MLSDKLTQEFGKGYSVTNLQNFRKFYIIFSEFSIQQTVSAKSENEIQQTLSVKFVLPTKFGTNFVGSTLFF